VQERRKSGRSRVLKGAKLVFGTSSVIDCVVHNVTNAGARVQIANRVELPDALGLTFDGGLHGPIMSDRVADADRNGRRVFGIAGRGQRANKVID